MRDKTAGCRKERWAYDLYFVLGFECSVLEMEEVRR